MTPKLLHKRSTINKSDSHSQSSSSSSSKISNRTKSVVLLSIPTMMNSTSCLFFVCFVIGSIECSNERIIGGSTAADGAHPYMVSIKIDGNHHCGGSIVSQQCILTAAHCLKSKDTNNTYVVAGIHLLSETGVQYSVKTFHYHENFIDDNLQNDVGVVILDKNIVFNNNVQPIKISRDNFIDRSVVATAIGWGSLTNGRATNALHFLELQVLNGQWCQFMNLGLKTESQMCTMNDYGEGICDGDSGGPLVFNGEQIGIVSSITGGELCARGSPDVFTRVRTFINWIQIHCSEI